MEHDDFEPVDVAVIGAGMAGLSTAVYARLSGLSVRVFERHYLPGGLCTAWKRKGYVFDYCVDYFLGTKRGHGFHDIWKTLGVMDSTKFRHIDSFGRYVGGDGRVLNLHTNHKSLHDHLIELSPADAMKIRELCNGIRKAGHMLMGEFSLAPDNLPKLLRSLRALPTMARWSGVSVADWCSGLLDPLLREGIPALLGSAEIPISGPMMVLGLMDRGFAEYPLGASLPIATAVEKQAKSLGAQFAYRCGVKRVIVENGCAAGIELEDGRVQRARHVVAACDARKTFDALLEGRIEKTGYEDLFEAKILYPSIVQVSLGVRIDPSWKIEGMPKRISFPVLNPVMVDGREHKRIAVYQYANDPRMAPEGCTAIVVQYEADYDRWADLRADAKSYCAEKRRIMNETVRALEERFPGIGLRIEASDAATPTTCERYTAGWRGSTQGWLMTPALMKKMMSGGALPKTFAGIGNFQLIGQWAEPGGGLPPAARMGRDAVRAIVKIK